MASPLPLPAVGPMEVLRRHLTQRDHRIRSLPVLILMPHSRCNCRCVMCDIWKANREGRQLTRTDLETHVESLRRLHAQWVVLSGGEPLMHPNLWALCRLLRELGVRITVLSTGLLLARHAEDLVRWSDDVIVSLDGSREVHDRIRRVPRAFDRLAEGVGTLKERDSGFPVTGRCVLQRLNFRDLPEIIRAAREVGLDQISFLAADVSTEAFNRPGGWGEERVADVALSPVEVAEFESVVEACIRLFSAEFASGFVAESPDRLRGMVRYFAALNGDGAFPETRCNAPWVSAVVEADGTVRPCFFHRALGNLADGPLDSILNSPDAVRFRENLDVKTNPICRKCVCTLSLGRTTSVAPQRAGDSP